MEKSREKRLALRATVPYRDTNRIWNYLKLNAGWSIGLMTKIVGENHFATFEDWERFYLESGKVRQELLKNESSETRTRLQNLRSVYEDSYNFRQGLSQHQININEAHGRTMEDIAEIGRYLYNGVVKAGNPFNVTENDCVTFAYIRIVDELYIGIERELNTTRTLQEKYPNLIFAKTTPYVDRAYAVDLEVYDRKRNLLCAIQIKSSHYKTNKSKILTDTKNFNEEKNRNYEDRYHVPVYYAYSTVEGRIEDESLFLYLDKIA